MQNYSNRNIHMFFLIKTNMHINTSSTKYHIKPFMQSSCNYIHTFCPIQTRRHIDASSHENHHKTCHTSLYYACSCFLVFVTRNINSLGLQASTFRTCLWSQSINSLILLIWSYEHQLTSLTVPKSINSLVLGALTR
jgi:hypothetical protein